MLGEHSASSDNRLGCQISHRAIFTSSRCSAATRVAGIIESVRYSSYFSRGRQRDSGYDRKILGIIWKHGQAADVSRKSAELVLSLM